MGSDEALIGHYGKREILELQKKIEKTVTGTNGESDEAIMAKMSAMKGGLQKVLIPYNEDCDKLLQRVEVFVKRFRNRTLNCIFGLFALYVLLRFPQLGSLTQNMGPLGWSCWISLAGLTAVPFLRKMRERSKVTEFVQRLNRIEHAAYNNQSVSMDDVLWVGQQPSIPGVFWGYVENDDEFYFC
ncbi:hypothetical protein BJ508DRAFT_419313 [Ascobolus immersus RN42]|uniref:Uncharacterized protein n=1 Tax=Ascobolus immersus RN42 TaxID=1160509 RepID=A0A3N4HKR6_ASCIM|nr:hypothetical protein BJ508DRAFT_419313 [Ascobolus immersus RN42]